MQESVEGKKKLIIKIVVTILAVCAVGGVWFVKNGQEPVAEGMSADDLKMRQEKEAVEGYFPLHVTEEIDLEGLKSYGLPIVIDFGADSCAPCKAMAPVLETLNEEMAGEAIVLFVDVWKYNDLASDFPIEVIPTQVFIDSEGNPYAPDENEEIQFLQYSYRDTGEIAFTVHQGGITEEQLRNVIAEMEAGND